MLAVERLGDGPPVVFVHGDIVGPSLTWRKQLELAERWSLIIPSRPGFGDSPPLERNDFELEAPLFAELLADGAHLVGHSYGAMIANGERLFRDGSVLDDELFLQLFRSGAGSAYTTPEQLPEELRRGVELL